MKTHVIDAQDKKLGRIASEAARVLMGKDTVDFAKNKIPSVQVHITNASKIAADITKQRSKVYQEYSGYPGGQKKITMEALKGKRGMDGVFRKAIKGMLPPNKLRAKMLNNLKVTE